jgi:cytochrome c553
MRLFAGLTVCLIALSASAAEIREADYAAGYFGELLPDLTPVQLDSATRGSKLFLKRWNEGARSRRNADSCVACHSVPMPGGSGMSAQALVGVDKDAPPGALNEVVQAGFPNPSPHANTGVRRTRALFGMGHLEFAAGGFGAFGSEPSLKAFVARTFATELGVSSSLQCARPTDAAAYPQTCDAAITDKELEDVVAYLRFLAPPPRSTQPPSADGRKVFEASGCAACHAQSLTTRADAPPPLQNRRFAAYTDRRVHDMGARAPVMTAPLWGVQSFGPPYMHDACGVSLVAAIECHHGEGRAAADAFNALADSEREKLLAFLRAL